jgi:cation:H+ antiporter
MTFVLFALGLVLLVLGAELLVRGASKLALSFGISPLVVGLTVVAFGTSSPEFAVSIQSAWAGQVDIALGNVVGSNIFNVLFILGLSALITPLLVARQLIRQEVPIMIGVSLLLFALAYDGGISRVDGAVMFGLLLAYTVFLVRQSRREGKAADAQYEAEFGAATKGGWDSHWGAQVLLLGVGLALLVTGANWLVDAAVQFAKQLGVSELVIGLTIVAAGTSMPEVATSIIAAVRGERDIAVGNVVGSNTFNILGCLGLSALAADRTGLAVPATVLGFDLWVMFVVALACLPVFMTGRRIERWEGGLFLAYYIAYAVWLIMAAQSHAAQGAYSQVMMSFVLPLTLVTLMVLFLRRGAGAGGGR